MKNIDGRKIEESKMLVYSITSSDNINYIIDMNDYFTRLETSDYKYRRDYYEAVIRLLPDYLPERVKHYLVYSD